MPRFRQTLIRFAQLLPWVAGLPLGSGAETVASEVDPEATHRIFVGTDVKVKWQDDFVNVSRFDGSRVVVRDPNSEPVILNKAEQFRWERRPKVSRSPVTIHNLDHTRLYSVSRDPATKWNAVQALMSSQQATKEQLAAGEVVAISGGQGPNQATLKQLYHVTPGQNSGLFVPDHGKYSEDLRTGRITLEQVATAASDVMTQTLEQGFDQPGQEFFQDRINLEEKAGDFDSFELWFDIESREAIADAYAVIRAKVVTPADAEGSVALFHQHLGRLESSPRRITVRKAGLPVGFKLEDIQVEIYAQGTEIGSNLSERSRPVSANAARGFLLLAHLADHKGETLPARAVWDLAPPELLAASEGNAFDVPVVVSLDEHGQVLGVFRTAAEAENALEIVDVSALRTKRTGETLRGMENLAAAAPSPALDPTGKLPPQIVSIVGRMVFMPALEEGYPVPSVSPINLADFFR